MKMSFTEEEYCEMILNGSLNCTIPSYKSYLFQSYFAKNESTFLIFLFFLLSSYIFLAMAVLCENYFIPSVEAICEELNVSNDIVGASFMAISTSAPELFINIIGTFIADDDIGLGTILGSALFNILFVTACITFASGEVLLKCWSLSRECLMYIISVGALCAMLYDDLITAFESTVLIIMYLLYIAALVFDKQIKKSWYELLKCLKISTNNIETQPSVTVEQTIDLYDEEDLAHPLRYPKKKKCFGQVWWFLCFPVNLIFYLTIPSIVKYRKLYVITFIISAVHIGIQSYVITWCFTLIGFKLKIAESIMGILFLAIGTSLPEAIGGVILAKKGYGSMGISNAIGSNTFDILICLGGPWFIRSVFFPKCKNLNFIYVNSSGMLYITLLLFSTAGFLYGALLINKFKLVFCIGVLCVLIYSVNVSIYILIELNLFFTSNNPLCSQ